MTLIDTHCHLEKFTKPGELEQTLQNAAAAGVEKLVTVGTSVEDWSLYERLAKQHKGRIYHTIGLHPCDVEDGWDEQVSAISTYFTTDPMPVALGEIGMDYYHLPKDPDEAEQVKAQQMLAFKAQLELAYQFGCPVVIHSRGCFADCFSVIDESGVDWKKVVFHCFADGPSEVKILNDRGGRASFTGITTYKNAPTVREAALAQGLDRLMVETDAPYLSPEPHRGKRCEPAFVAHTAERLAELFEVSLEELAQKTTQNAVDFYELA